MRKNDDAPKILNIKQLAERLNMPVPTLRGWLKADKCPIPHIEGMKPRKWRTSDVENFLGASKDNSAGR
jgi:predicted DNA-binding transcriptional regulator AlpA